MCISLQWWLIVNLKPLQLQKRLLLFENLVSRETGKQITEINFKSDAMLLKDADVMLLKAVVKNLVWISNQQNGNLPLFSKFLPGYEHGFSICDVYKWNLRFLNEEKFRLLKEDLQGI